MWYKSFSEYSSSKLLAIIELDERGTRIEANKLQKTAQLLMKTPDSITSVSLD